MYSRTFHLYLNIADKIVGKINIGWHPNQWLLGITLFPKLWQTIKSGTFLDHILSKIQGYYIAFQPKNRVWCFVMYRCLFARIILSNAFTLTNPQPSASPKKKDKIPNST